MNLLPQNSPSYPTKIQTSSPRALVPGGIESVNRISVSYSGLLPWTSTHVPIRFTRRSRDGYKSNIYSCCRTLPAASWSDVLAEIQMSLRFYHPTAVFHLLGHQAKFRSRNICRGRWLVSPTALRTCNRTAETATPTKSAVIPKEIATLYQRDQIPIIMLEPSQNLMVLYWDQIFRIRWSLEPKTRSSVSWMRVIKFY